MGHNDDNLSSEGSDNFGWSSDDDCEIDDYPNSLSLSLTQHGGEATSGSGLVKLEASSSAGSSNAKLFAHFVSMGYSEEMVAKAINQNGDEDENLILDFILNYSFLDDSSENKPVEGSFDPSPSVCERSLMEDFSDCDDYSDEKFLDDSSEKQLVEGSFDPSPSVCERSLMEDFSDGDDYSDEKVARIPSSDEKRKLLILTEMGYLEDEASIAMDRCGAKASVDELTDFISAAQVAREADTFYPEVKPKMKILSSALCKKRQFEYERKRGEKRVLHEDDESLHLPNPMIGFGVPSESHSLTHRDLPEAAIGPPYFYYENVALAPKGVWDTISRCLYDIKPEFVDSKYFCAAARKRGYVHNLPINDRYPFTSLPRCTIQEALSHTKEWWPSWDMRTQLNCLQTCVGSARLTDRLRKALEECDNDSDPPPHIQKYILYECRKWNLIWVGKNKLAPLEPDEVELILGFPTNHTRGSGMSKTDRYKSLGNSFQVDTVAYHLSVLKKLFPGGMNVLSLFSGIGGAEVALHKLGIPLRNVVSVEKSKVNRNIVRSWWEQTNQKGNLIEFEDVQQLNGDRLEQLISTLGGFDLVIGGSPCNNLTGSNRHHRDGLEGKESALFYDYCRILESVKSMMSRGHLNCHR